jgi:cytoskeletal protein CcmA (bactofilin family)
MFKSKKGSVSDIAADQAPLPSSTHAAAPLPAPEPLRPNYISARTVIEGNIISHEDLTLDGRVKGDVKTSARLCLGPESVVEGNIVAAEAEVAGRITGTVESKGLLAIKSTCRIEGDIITRSLHVESGSSFNGRCKVGCDTEPDGARSAVVNRVRSIAPLPTAAKTPVPVVAAMNS